MSLETVYDEDRGTVPLVPVSVQNWPATRKVANVTLKTWVLDPTGAVGPKNVPICDFEPNRELMTIYVIDVPVALTLEPPVNSPDTSAAGVAPQGAHLPIGIRIPIVGKDAMWLNSLAAITRVTVIKEYCAR